MKQLQFILLFLFLGISGFSQKLYVKTFGNYSFPLGSQNLNMNSTFAELEIQDFVNYENGKYEQVRVSLGKGINLGFGGGFVVNENLKTEINFAFLLGGKSESVRNSGYEEEKSVLSSKMFQAIPALVISGKQKTLTPYMRTGLIIATGSVLHEKTVEGNGNSYRMDVKFNKGIAFGAEGALGMEYKIKERYSAGLEIRFTSLSYSPTHGEVVTLEENGVSFLNSIPDEMKEFDLQKSSSNDVDKLRYKFPFGSVGVAVFFKLF